MHQNEQGSPEAAGRREAGLLLLVVRALACSLEVFFHKSSTFGERYLGAQAAIAAAIIFFFPIFAEGQDPTALYGFLLAFLFMCTAARAGVLDRRRRGDLGPHSYYTGTPRIMGRTPERTVKGVIEPIVVWVLAAMLSEDSPLLAGYLAIAATGLLISVQLTLTSERRRLVDMHDAFMEQRDTVENWRSLHRDP